MDNLSTWEIENESDVPEEVLYDTIISTSWFTPKKSWVDNPQYRIVETENYLAVLNESGENVLYVGLAKNMYDAHEIGSNSVG